jgi:hypothetical protein
VALREGIFFEAENLAEQFFVGVVWELIQFPRCGCRDFDLPMRGHAVWLPALFQWGRDQLIAELPLPVSLTQLTRPSSMEPNAQTDALTPAGVTGRVSFT